MPEGVHVDDPPRRPREHAGLIVAPHVAIVGAGVRGLASAVYLRSRGYGITIFEQASTCGGMWTRVYDTSFINTPNHGYTFHPGNRWRTTHPWRVEIMGNLQRMVEAERLDRHLVLDTRIEGVERTVTGKWRVDEWGQEFDGVLVCTGFLGEPRAPDRDVGPEMLLDGELHVLGGHLSQPPWNFTPERSSKVHVLSSLEGFHSVASPGRYSKVFGSGWISGAYTQSHGVFSD